MHIASVAWRRLAALTTSFVLAMTLYGCGDARVGRIGGITGPTGGDTTTAASISVSPSSATIVVGASQGFSATAKNAAGNAVAATVAWSSSNTAVATVSASGTASAVGAGTATITASSGSVSGKATLTVTATSPP